MGFVHGDEPRQRNHFHCAGMGVKARAADILHMTKVEINPAERTPGELEEYMIEESGLPPFETPCQRVAKDAHVGERMTVVASRRTFYTTIEDDMAEVPPKSYLVGEADYTDNFRNPSWLRESWADGLAPTVGDEHPVAAVGGEFFGRDNSVFILAHMTIADLDLETVALVSAFEDTV